MLFKAVVSILKKDIIQTPFVLTRTCDTLWYFSKYSSVESCLRKERCKSLKLLTMTCEIVVYTKLMPCIDVNGDMASTI